MELCVLCAYDQKGTLKHGLFFLLPKSMRSYRTTRKGSSHNRFILSRHRDLLHRRLSRLCLTLTICFRVLSWRFTLPLTTSCKAVSLRPMIKNVRVLTLPYLEFEYCNVYRVTYGKTLPLSHRHPDAAVILWNKGDHDHVFFLAMAQLLPCLKDTKADNWSMIVFWNESKGPTARRGPDVGQEFHGSACATKQ